MEAQNHNVLLVEDDIRHAELVADLFEMVAPHVVIDRACSAEDALAWLDEHTDPDLVLLDLCLPGLDGWAVLETVRHTGAAACPPVVVLTSSADAVDRKRACSLGANAYMEKPLSARHLRRQIEAVVTCWLDRGDDQRHQVSPGPGTADLTDR